MPHHAVEERGRVVVARVHRDGEARQVFGRLELVEPKLVFRSGKKED
jgi:hypothetical protein